jgi:hypothetical protein
MYIGEYLIGAKYELALDPSEEYPFHVMVKEFEAALDLSGEHYNDNYVSWWPEEFTGLTGRQTAAYAMPGKSCSTRGAAFPTFSRTRVTKPRASPECHKP